MAKKSTKKTATKKAVQPAPRKNKTVRECMAESQALKMHVTAITILSIIICGLVIALVLALKD